jgi:transposase
MVAGRRRDGRRPPCEEARDEEPAWLGQLMERRPTKVAAVALVNKIARVAWAIMVHRDRSKDLL